MYKKTERKCYDMDRKQALIELYKQCLESNCTDMNEKKHQFKAKAFATDLGLEHSNIAYLLSEAKTAYYRTQTEQERQAWQEKQKKKKTIKIISAVVILVALITAVLLYTFITTEQNYQAALRQLDLGCYDDAIEKFRNLNNYKDSAELIKESQYQKIWHKMENYMDTIERARYIAVDFKNIGDYKDCQEIAEQLWADADRYEELVGVPDITREEIEKEKQTIEANKYFKVTDYYQAQIYAFDMLHEVQWEYLSGDPYAVSMATKNKREIRNLNTSLYNLNQWQSKYVTLYEGEDSIYSVGIIKGSTYTNKYKEQTIFYKETAFSEHDVSASFDGNNDTLTITVEKSNGNTYSCTYKKVQ